MALAMQSLPYVYKLPNGTYIHITMRQYGDVAPLTDQEREDWKNDMARLTAVEEIHLSKHNVERETAEGTIIVNGALYTKVPVVRTTYLDADEGFRPDFSDDYYAIMWKWGAIMAEDPNISYHAPETQSQSKPNNQVENAPSPCVPRGTHGNGHKMCTWSSII